MPLVGIVFLVGVVLVLVGIGMNILKGSKNGIWFAGLGTVLTVWMLLLNVGFNNTAYYPSTYDLQSSLTIANSSSSQFTLLTMSYVSLLVPFVLAYIWVVWKKIDSKAITRAEINHKVDADTHIY